MIIAAIDIGSNAARLLINDVKETNGKAEFTKLNLLRIPLRLGFDVFSKGEIGPERKQMVIKTMTIFRELMEIYKVQHYRACATSAMRDAKNGQEIIDIVKAQADINIEIITGDEEATLIYENHVAEGLDKDFAYLYIDVGGGSTELTFYENNEMQYEHSFDIGTIRLLNGLVTPKIWDDMKEEIKEKIKSKKTLVAIGSGGNINKIFAMSKTKEAKPMAVSVIKKYLKEMQQYTVEERMQHYEIREDRADVIVPALQIFSNVMTWADIKQIYVPKISVADGLVKSIYYKL
ncbi:MAG: exopolyphosphatase [Weeksellaceae bacterium]|nr:exopolyphosphatase [Weeksellaceae bacterium]